MPSSGYVRVAHSFVLPLACFSCLICIFFFFFFFNDAATTDIYPLSLPDALPISFPWVHHESAELALDYAIAFLEAKLKPGIGLEAKAESSWRSPSGCSQNRSAGYVQDRVDSVRVLLQYLDCLSRRQHEQLDAAALGFLFHFFHDRQGAGSGADHQLPAFPGDLFFDRERCVAEGVAKLFGCLLLALPDLAAVDEHVMFVGDAIDADRTE